MEKDFWCLGSPEEVTKTITLKEIRPDSVKQVNDQGIYFLKEESFVIDNKVYVPLELFLTRTELQIEWLMSDEFLEIMNKMKKRTGIFPIQKLTI